MQTARAATPHRRRIKNRRTTPRSVWTVLVVAATSLPANARIAQNQSTPATTTGGGTITPTDILIPLGLLILVLVLFGTMWKIVRDRMRGDGADSGGDSGGLLVEQMRAMVRRGELSEAEFESARAAWKRAAIREKEKFLGTSANASAGAGEVGAGGGGGGGGGGEGGRSENVGRGGVRRVGADGTIRAKPGFDLTGRPLPGQGEGDGTTDDADRR